MNGLWDIFPFPLENRQVMTPKPCPCVQDWSTHGSTILGNHFWSHIDGTDKITKRHSLRPAWAYRKENRNRVPFILRQLLLILGLLIFMGFISIIFYNISNAQNWITSYTNHAQNFKFGPFFSQLLNLHCFKTPVCGRGTDIIISILFIGKLWPRAGRD